MAQQDVGGAEAPFQEYDEDKREESLRTELREAVNDEREAASRIEEQIDKSDLEEGVEHYARNYLRNISGFESLISQRSLYRLDKGGRSGRLHRPESSSGFESESPAATPAANGEAEDKKAKETPVCLRPFKQLWDKVMGLTQIEKNIIRHVIVCVVGLLLPYSPTIRLYGGSLTNLISVYTVVLPLRPLQQTCIGMEVNHSFIFMIIWPLIYAYTVFMASVSLNNLGGYATLQSLAIMVLILMVWKHPTNLTATIIQLVNFSLIAVAIFANANFKSSSSTDEEIFDASIKILNYGTFAMGIPYALHLAAAFIFFPFLGVTRMKAALSSRYSAHASLLHKLRPIYDRIAMHSLDPANAANYDSSNVDAELLQELEEAHQRDISSIALAQTWFEAALVETRFKFNGEGMAYLDRYERSLHMTRIARSTALDILGARSKDFNELARDLHADKRLFRKQTAALDICVNDEENERHKVELKRIPMLITELSLLMELGAHRLAKLAGSDPGCKGLEKEFEDLESEQKIMNKIASELESLAVTWTRRYVRMHAAMAYESSTELVTAFFKRIKIITYIQAMLKLTKAHEDTLITFRTESLRDKKDWQKEWKYTFPFVDKLINGKQAAARSALYEAPETFLGRCEALMVRFFNDSRWKGSLKYTFGTVMLSLPGMLSTSYAVYSTVQLVNAIFTFQVVLLKTEAGLVIERFLHRLGGIAAGLVLAGIAWEFTCIGGCGQANRQWIFLAFELIALGVYFYIKQIMPMQAYAFFSLLRTITSMVVVYFSVAEPTQLYYWLDAGYVMLSSVIGAVGALFLALCIWPVSGRSLIRKTLATVFHDYILLYEQVLTARFRDPSMSESEDPKITAFEDQIGTTLYVNMAMKLRSAKLETKQNLHYDAPYDEYVAVVESTRRIWHSLWKMHHLGGIRIYLRNRCGEAVDGMLPETARAYFAINRWLTSAFTAVSARLVSERRDSLPVLRPLAATPSLLTDMVHAFLRQAYHDDIFIKNLLESDDLSLLLNLPLMAQNLVLISHSLDEVYTFLEHFLLTPTYAKDLRLSEQASFNVYTHEHPVITIM
mmetsp:Transcript_11373/g.22228  ORF Transcript_11373/g.22228 Transcript_11373/m.22228 type:complete len:1070 (-) Transcript_11373:107-3316(-)|eukprot:CAMPEP_0171589294 /NCGR_PEP_ID=MMETSP0961-20121227/14742_1 /TAXON_ID=87120 /ORGANISM="Aurantiochytrium limacinum, Strain ATCCMYA-1381" /LENGTH=1069 /DNA_ID=CAMNT_0012148523 /DNA_START=306 /DNA_END=3512 /DNA_ORIENTATION=+